MQPDQLDLRDVSLVCVETRRPQLALYALARCLRQARFKEVRLLGSGQPVPSPDIAASALLDATVEHVRIRAITSVADYSRFMVRELGHYFSGSHALVVQWDGFITDAGRWDPRFLEYDYIGAPWPGQTPAVGNGGFSLRSRRLVDALQAMHTPVTHPEDHCICDRYRPQLERDHGVRFAPPEVAGRFSWEAAEPPVPTFGFHSFFNFHRVLAEAELLDYFDLCDAALLHSIPARRLLKNLYRASMHRAADKLHAIRMAGPAAMRMDALKLRTFARARALLRAD
jgi:hypothetical protein